MKLGRTVCSEILHFLSVFYVEDLVRLGYIYWREKYPRNVDGPHGKTLTSLAPDTKLPEPIYNLEPVLGSWPFPRCCFFLCVWYNNYHKQGLK